MLAAAAAAVTYVTAVSIGLASRLPLCSSQLAARTDAQCHHISLGLLFAAPLPLWCMTAVIVINLKDIHRREPTIELLELEIADIIKRSPWPRHPSSRGDSAQQLYRRWHVWPLQGLIYAGVIGFVVAATAGAYALLCRSSGAGDHVPGLRWAMIGLYAVAFVAVVIVVIVPITNPHTEHLKRLRSANPTEGPDGTPLARGERIDGE
jgi:hypothetical protein